MKTLHLICSTSFLLGIECVQPASLEQVGLTGDSLRLSFESVINGYGS